MFSSHVQGISRTIWRSSRVTSRVPVCGPVTRLQQGHLNDPKTGNFSFLPSRQLVATTYILYKSFDDAVPPFRNPGFTMSIVAKLEAQPSPSTPVAAYTHTPCAPPADILHAPSDPIDDFFGLTRGSRHDRRLSADVSDALPAYVAEDSALPHYSVVAPEHITLAMYLFKFGFRACSFIHFALVPTNLFD